MGIKRIVSSHPSTGRVLWILGVARKDCSPGDGLSNDPAHHDLFSTSRQPSLTLDLLNIGSGNLGQTLRRNFSTYFFEKEQLRSHESEGIDTC